MKTPDFDDLDEIETLFIETAQEMRKQHSLDETDMEAWIVQLLKYYDSAQDDGK